MAAILLILCLTTTSRIKAALSGPLWSWTADPFKETAHDSTAVTQKKKRFTWPELQQVVQYFDVFFEVQSARQLLRVDENAVGVAGRLLTLAEQNWAETHGQVLARHLVHVLVGRHTLQVVEKRPQSHLRQTHTNTKKRHVITMISSCRRSSCSRIKKHVMQHQEEGFFGQNIQISRIFVIRDNSAGNC